jgi:glucan 1,3-beta-glucosidase
VNQTRYVREFTALAEKRGIRYNLIEAFDQPWKRVPEGTVGGHWGLYDVEGREKFPWSGPVAEAPQGRNVVAVAAVAAALVAFAGLLWGGAARARVGLTLAASAALLVGIGARQLQDLLVGNATALDWATTLAVALAGWLAFGLAVRSMLAQPAPRDPMPRLLTLLLLLSCAYVCLGLVFAGRHRDFPVWLFLPGVLGIAISAVVNPLARAARLRRERAIDEVLLAAWLVVAACLVPLLERFQNGRSLGWGITSLLLGSAILLPLALEARKHQRTAEHTDAGPGEAVQHHAEGADRDGERRRQR